MLGFGGQDVTQQGRLRAPQQPARPTGQQHPPGEQAPGLNHYAADPLAWGDHHLTSGVAPGSAMEGGPETDRHGQSAEQGHAAAGGGPLIADGDPSGNQMHVVRTPGGAPMAPFHPASRPWTPGRPPPHHPYRSAPPRHAYYGQYARHPHGMPPYSSVMHHYAGAPPPPLVGRRQHPGFPPPSHMAYPNAAAPPPPPPGYGGVPEEELQPPVPSRAFTSPFLAADAQVAALGPGGEAEHGAPLESAAALRHQHSEGGAGAGMGPPLLAPTISEGGATSGMSRGGAGGAAAAAGGALPGSYSMGPPGNNMYGPPYGPPYRPRQMMYPYHPPPHYYHPEDVSGQYGRRLPGTQSMPLPGYGGPGYGGPTSGGTAAGPPLPSGFMEAGGASGPSLCEPQTPAAGEPGGQNGHRYSPYDNPPYGGRNPFATPHSMPPPPGPLSGGGNGNDGSGGGAGGGGGGSGGGTEMQAPPAPYHHPHHQASSFGHFSGHDTGHALHHPHGPDAMLTGSSESMRRAYSADTTQVRMVGPSGGGGGGAAAGHSGHPASAGTSLDLYDPANGGCGAAASADVMAQVDAELPLPLPLPELLAHLGGSPNADADDDEQLHAELHGFIGDLSEGYEGPGGAMTGALHGFPGGAPRAPHSGGGGGGGGPMHSQRQQHGMSYMHAGQQSMSQPHHHHVSNMAVPPQHQPQQQQTLGSQQQQQQQQHHHQAQMTSMRGGGGRMGEMSQMPHIQGHLPDEMGMPGLQPQQIQPAAGPGRRGPGGRGRGGGGGAAAAAAGNAGAAGLATDGSEAAIPGAGRAGRDGDLVMAHGHAGDRPMGHAGSGLVHGLPPWESGVMGMGDSVGMRGAMQMPPGGGRRGGGMQMPPMHVTHGSLSGAPGGGVAGYSGAGSAEHGDEHPGGEVVDGEVCPAGASADQQGDVDGDADGDGDGDADADGAAEDSWVPGNGSGGGGLRRTTDDGEAHQRRPRRKIVVRRIKGRAGGAHRRESTGVGAGGAAAAAAAAAAGAASAASGDELQLGARPTLEQLLSQSVDTVADLDVLGDLEPQTVSALLEKVQRKGKGGRAPAEDPRLDPSIDPRKARRILANRISAARSKLKQKLILEGLKARYQQLLSSKNEYSRELADLKRSCKELETRNRGLAVKIKDLNLPSGKDSKVQHA